jgi:hypothetical protein
MSARQPGTEQRQMPEAPETSSTAVSEGKSAAFGDQITNRICCFCLGAEACDVYAMAAL